MSGAESGRQLRQLIVDAAAMRLSTARARAAECTTAAAAHAQHLRRRAEVIDTLTQLRAAAEQVTNQLQVNRQEASATSAEIEQRSGRKWTQLREPQVIRLLTEHLHQLDRQAAELEQQQQRISDQQRRLRAGIDQPAVTAAFSPEEIAKRQHELQQATHAYAYAQRQLADAADTTPTPDDRAGTGQVTPQAAARMATQLSRYLAGPGQARARWKAQTGSDGAQHWTSRRHDRAWSLHISNPTHPSFLTDAGRAVTALATAEQRPLAAVIDDILATESSDRTEAREAQPPRSPLLELWSTHAPRQPLPQVVTQPLLGDLDSTIREVFTAGYRHGWHHRLHAGLVGEGTAALDRLDQRGGPQEPALPRNVSDLRRLYDQATVASVERYLAEAGWQPLDHTEDVRRWHDGADTIVEVPTGDQDRRTTLRDTARTIADQQDREVYQVLSDFAEPALRDHDVARIHALITNPPTVSDAQIAARLADLSVTADAREVPLLAFARRQVDTLGASDMVWKVATVAGEADAADRVTRLLREEAPVPVSQWSARPFAYDIVDRAEDVAARIWAAGDHLRPVAHARWFTHTWWPYHVASTAGTVAQVLLAQIGLSSENVPLGLPPGAPGHGLLRTVAAAAQPDWDSGERFLAVYRLVDAAARSAAVDIASYAVRKHLLSRALAIDETTLADAVRYANDPRRFGNRPTDAALKNALLRAQPPDRRPAPDVRRAPTSKPQWAVAIAAARPSATAGRTLVTNTAQHHRRQLLASAVVAVRRNHAPPAPRIK